MGTFAEQVTINAPKLCWWRLEAHCPRITWAAITVALIGPLLYADAMFIHLDAQGALVILMVPVIQLALICLAVVVVAVWQVVGLNSAGAPAENRTRT